MKYLSKAGSVLCLLHKMSSSTFILTLHFT